MKGLVFVVTAIHHTSDSRLKTTRDGKTTMGVEFELLTLSLPFDDEEFSGESAIQVANIRGPYYPESIAGGDITITIVEPELMNRFKLGDRIDLLKNKL